MIDMTLGRWSHVPAISNSVLQFPANGNRLSPEPACRFSTIFKQNFNLRTLFDAVLLYGFRNLFAGNIAISRVVSLTHSCQV